MMGPVLYSGANCTACNNLKMWLQSNNVNYIEKGIDAALEKGYRSIPVVEYRGEVVIGFNEATKKRLMEMFPE